MLKRWTFAIGLAALLGSTGAVLAKSYLPLPEMVRIPAGAALIGSSEAETTREGRTPAFAAFEHPQRMVQFDRPFAIGKYHVTKAQYGAFVRATGRNADGCTIAIGGQWSAAPLAGHDYARPGFAQRPDEPAVCVSWEDATAYAAWLSARTGQRFRLPREDEWEYAARGGTQTARWWGDGANDLCARANGGDRAYGAVFPADKSANQSCSDGYIYTSPVGRYRANRFGLHDMYGNAWQWTADCFAAIAGSAAPQPCAGHAIRGGSWHNSRSTLRSATRFSLPPAMRSSSLGFRVLREL